MHRVIRVYLGWSRNILHLLHFRNLPLPLALLSPTRVAGVLTVTPRKNPGGTPA